MNALVKSDQPPAQQKLMLLDYMADKYSLTADEFRKTVRATCGLGTATPEQVAAFLIVAKEYDLNPLTKEIYAFPGKGGGIVPIVSIDGWVNLVNSHPQCDGFEFAPEFDQKGDLFSYTCTMHRKDRKHPTAVTEFLSECIRSTEPWKMKHRMLRHKSLIQAARYAFGFAGIYDEDEGRIIAENGESAAPATARDAGPPRGATVVQTVKAIEHKPAEEEKRDPISSGVEQQETGSHVSGDPVDDIPEDQQADKVSAAPEPHEIVPDAAVRTNSFEGWATAYIKGLETSPDKSTMFAWVDKNVARLKTLEKSPEWTAKVKKATQNLAKALDKAAEQPTQPARAAQDASAEEMGGDAAPKGGKGSRGPRKAAGGKVPDFMKDYDGWLKFHLDAIAAATTPEAIETLFEQIDGRWDELMPPDKETLMGARREAEGKLEQ